MGRTHLNANNRITTTPNIGAMTGKFGVKCMVAYSISVVALRSGQIVYVLMFRFSSSKMVW